MSIITAKYPGTCSVCGSSIRPGEQIEYQKGQPTRHAKCKAPEIPADAIRIGGGSGYGCTGWKQGQVVRNRDRNIEQGQPEWLYVLTASARYIREDGMSFGVGDESGYVYSAVCRPATADEASPLIAAREAKAARQRAQEELRGIFGRIQSEGVRPEGENVPEGTEIIVDGEDHRIYGGGRWFVVGPECVWAVQNNGADGDNWACNNVSIRMPYT